MFIFGQMSLLILGFATQHEENDRINDQKIDLLQQSGLLLSPVKGKARYDPYQDGTQSVASEPISISSEVRLCIPLERRQAH